MSEDLGSKKNRLAGIPVFYHEFNPQRESSLDQELREIVEEYVLAKKHFQPRR